MDNSNINDIIILFKKLGKKKNHNVRIDKIAVKIIKKSLKK